VNAGIKRNPEVKYAALIANLKEGGAIAARADEVNLVFPFRNPQSGNVRRSTTLHSRIRRIMRELDGSGIA